MSRPYKRIRNECQTLLNKGIIRKSNQCANCGATEGLELHHIVPIARGGRNTPENTVTLCCKCHAAAHDKFRQKGPNSGRNKTKKPEDLNAVLEQVIAGEMESREAWELLHVGHSLFYRWMQEYLNEKGIKRNGKNFGRGGKHLKRG